MKKFIFQSERDVENPFDFSSIIMTVETDGLAELIEEFENFIRANGFHFNGHLGFINED